ncbi:hypothetical protein CI109_102773 [Kwoniella shandongensis]|uniref:Uncharacterized protein n=1 Tax=Kwoniella shandongensis TaxID=1734106 RepID=A0A5M6BVC1_9TREE|nr:uncharacterized protein CI109_004906 [Kwoniella shandongensis]KAA5526703.1 hypothetical protein CI109_004906 [Kwoniella shandongensis]
MYSYIHLAIPALIALLPNLVQAGPNVFPVGCVSPSGVPANAIAYDGATSKDECTAGCSDNNFPYTFWSDGALTQCYCAIEGPVSPASTYQDAYDRAQCISSFNYNVNFIGLDYGFDYCLNPQEFGEGATGFSQLSDAFNACKNVQYTVAIPVSGGYAVYCLESEDEIGIAKCSSTSAYSFSHAIAVSPSGIPGRKRRELLRRARLVPEFCPKGLTPCAVAGSDSYECIDTNLELESCGGCTNGLYQDYSHNATIGVDCSTIPGVASGAVTCQSGECSALACKSGWTLQHGTCVIV